MEPIINYILIVLGVAIFIIFLYLFVGFPTEKKVTWGVNYSVKQADYLEIDSRKAYIALLDELNFKNVKLSVHWDLLQPKNQYEYDFIETDWQIKEAEKRNIDIVLAIGMKTPRWPECHIPYWARDYSKEEQQKAILNMITTVIERYKDSKVISAWQIENEPFLKFGICPWADKSFLGKEVALVKKLDPSRNIIATDSGEMSLWWRISSYGDIVGVTTYRKVWQSTLKMYVDYFLPPVYYQRRAEIVKLLSGKEVIGTELQAEPWCKDSMLLTSLEEQARTMNPEQFQKNIKFAQQTGFKKFYLWGGEWWYWQKEKHKKEEMWQEVKKLLQENNY